MKRIFLLSFGIVAFTITGFAQTEAPEALTRAPRQTKSQTEAMSKMKKEGKKNDVKIVTEEESNNIKYKKAGLSDSQIVELNDSKKSMEKQKNAITNDPKLTTDEKKKALRNIDTEKNATMKKVMGEDAYNKYNSSKPEQGKTKNTTKQ